MYEGSREWLFMRRRAEQLFEEGDVRAALRLMRRINLAQAGMFDECEEEYEQTENC